MNWFPFRGRERKAAPGPLVALSHLKAAHWTEQTPAALARTGYRQNAIAYRCVRMIAEAAGSVPLKVDEAHGPLFASPNSDQSGVDLREAFFARLQLYGTAFLEAVRLPGTDRVVGLHGGHPLAFRALEDQTGRLTGWRIGPEGRHRDVGRDERGWMPVFCLGLFDPDAPHGGQSPLMAAATALDIHNAGAQWTKALIDNSARPSGALVYGREGGHLTEDQFERLKAQLEEGYAGARNAGRPMLLEGGLDWTPMSLSPADMDFIEARREAAREIALAFGVPPMLLGIPGDNTYANYREANLAFWRHTILPLVRRFASGVGGWLDAEVRPDLEAVAALAPEREALWARVTAAEFLTDEEKRERVGA